MVQVAPNTAEREARGPDGELIRRRLRCRGLVQGVGFRPAVYRLATSLGLGGSVRNDSDGATIELAGEEHAVARFVEALAGALPPLARLDAVEVSEMSGWRAEGHAREGFRVEASAEAPRRRALIPPDALVCGDCAREQRDPADRRYRYPFTTCTNCGPRFSLSTGLPYDRVRTSMARFPLCEACAAEYHDPADRRFHAEPVCCPRCGPALWLADREGETLARDQAGLAAARQALADGRIVAIKGLGGFQLACRCDDARALARLRDAKQRPTRPFAVMGASLDVLRSIVCLDRDAEALLHDTRAPIVLAPRRPDAPVDEAVAPGLDDIGVLLPTTPLHAELFRGAPYDALVMTSGNAHDEPIARTNEEALARLAGFADAFLLHDREVVRRIDDSVVRTTRDGAMVVRRSRGYVPEPSPLPVATPEPVLALGGHLQTTACLGLGEEAFASQHVGDLDTNAARAFLLEAALGLEDFLEVEAGVLAVDLHPDYPSVWAGEALARERGGRVIRLQHHLAHAAGVLAEHAAFPREGERVAALVLDGTGYGPDETAWGGEWLTLGGDLGWRRVAHSAPLPLLGGEAAVREPWRIAVAALAQAGALEGAQLAELAKGVAPERFESVCGLALREGWPLASGAGRVFEAAGALLGLGPVNHWEGELAARLEALASRWPEQVEAWPEVALEEGSHQLPSPALLAAAARRVAAGEAHPRIAKAFHATFCALAATLSARVLPPEIDSIALAGGCLVNRLLRRQLSETHERLGYRVLLPRAFPPGDGGLSHGQTVLAGVSLALGAEPRFEGAS